MIYSVAAVAVAIGLAISITLAFPPAAQAPKRFSSGSCPSTGLPLDILPPVSVLKPNGTVTINGTTYWYVTFIPDVSLTSEGFRFQGVNFSMGSASSDILVSGARWTLTNDTVLTTLVNGRPSCWFFLPWVGISFSDGSSVEYNTYTASVGVGPGNNQTTYNLTFDRPTSNPWFTQPFWFNTQQNLTLRLHTDPQAGVGYQTDGGEITLYVSTS